MLNPPSILQLEVTKNCNFKCIMCHKGQSLLQGKDFLRDDLYDVARRQIRPVFPYLQKAMLFGDGEPMVYPYFWDIVKEIKEASPGCVIDFINNGSMMHATNRQKLFDYKISHLGLSLGGACAKSHNFARPPGLFDKIINNYSNLYKEKQHRGTLEPYVAANVVVMQCNYKEIPALIRLCDRLGIFRLDLQKLFVTHNTIKSQQVSDAELEPYLVESTKVAQDLGIGFSSYPMSSNVVYQSAPQHIRSEDPIFREIKDGTSGEGYCCAKQPWNTVYVLHDGTVVPDCHWWTSARETSLNICGKLDQTTDILDVWNNNTYQEIRKRIETGNFLPQCRGCGLAGGVAKKYRGNYSDHTDPDYESRWDNPSFDSSKIGLLNRLQLLSDTPTSLAILDTVVNPQNVEQEESSSKNIRYDELYEMGLNSFYLQWLSKQWNCETDLQSLAQHYANRIIKYNSQFDYGAYLSNIEIAFREEEEKKSYLKCSPLVVDCELSDLCDYQCITCQPAMFKRGHIMDKEVVDDILTQLVPLAEIVDYAKLGEPFALKERMIYTIKMSRRLNPCIHQRLFSHGQKIDDEIIATLVDYEFENLTVSIDGSSCEQFSQFTQVGNLNQVIYNLERLQLYKKIKGSQFPKVTFATQLTSYIDPLAVMKLAKRAGVSHVSFTGVIIFPDNEKKYHVSSIVGPGAFGGKQALFEKMQECHKFAYEHNIGFGYPKIEGKEEQGVGFKSGIPNLVAARHDPNQTCPTREPWYRWCMSGTGHIGPCCHHPPLVALESSTPSEMPIVGIKEAWNHPRMQNIRKLLASGQYTTGCQCESKMNFDKSVIDYKNSHSSTTSLDLMNVFVSEDGCTTYYSPVAVEIDPITQCNLNCVMCHNSHGNYFAPWKVDLNSIQHIRDHLSESRFPSAVSLAGAGEFFLHSDWKEILETLSEADCDIEILTNGTTLSEKHIDYLWSQTTVKLLQFSLDAASEDRFYNIRGSDKWVQIKSLMKYACSHPSRKMVRLSFVVMNENMRDIVPFVKIAKEIGADGILYQHMHDRPLKITRRSNGFVFDESQRPNKQKRKELITKAYTLAQELGLFVQINQMPEIELSTHPYEEVRRRYYKSSHGDVSENLPIKPKCWLPWVMLNRTFEESWRVCCMSDMQSYLGGKGASIKEAWNSTEIQDIRRQILAGKCPKQCLPEFCHIAKELKEGNTNDI